MTDDYLFRMCERDAKTICEMIIPNSGVPAEGLAKAMAHFYQRGNYDVLNRFVWADVTRKALGEFYPNGDLPAPYDKPYQ